MQALTKVHGEGERRARVSDELRQLKQMSNGLRKKAARAMVKRHASEPVEHVPVPASKRAAAA